MVSVGLWTAFAIGCSSYTPHISTSTSSRTVEKDHVQPADDDQADASVGTSSQVITGTNLDELHYGTAAADCRFVASMGTLGGVNCQTANTGASGPHRVSKRESGLDFEWRVNAGDEVHIQCPASRKNVSTLNCSFISRPGQPVRIYLTLSSEKDKKEVVGPPISPAPDTGGSVGSGTTGSSSSFGGGGGATSFGSAASYAVFISSRDYQGNATMDRFNNECQSDLAASYSLVHATRYNKSRAFVGGAVVNEANQNAAMKQFTLVSGSMGLESLYTPLNSYLDVAVPLLRTVTYALPNEHVGTTSIWTGWRILSDPEGVSTVGGGPSCNSWSSLDATGATGSTGAVGSQRLRVGDVSCSESHRILCIAWQQ